MWIGYDAIIETAYPHLVTIRDRAAIGMRVTIIAHNREQRGVVIEEDVTLAAGVIVLLAVTIERGAIVTAGSVVTKSVAPKTMVQGNPAQPIATVETPLARDVSVKRFAKGLKPLRKQIANGMAFGFPLSRARDGLTVAMALLHRNELAQ